MRMGRSQKATPHVAKATQQLVLKVVTHLINLSEIAVTKYWLFRSQQNYLIELFVDSGDDVLGVVYIFFSLWTLSFFQEEN